MSKKHILALMTESKCTAFLVSKLGACGGDVVTHLASKAVWIFKVIEIAMLKRKDWKNKQ